MRISSRLADLALLGKVANLSDLTKPLLDDASGSVEGLQLNQLSRTESLDSLNSKLSDTIGDESQALRKKLTSEEEERQKQFADETARKWGAEKEAAHASDSDAEPDYYETPMMK